MMLYWVVARVYYVIARKLWVVEWMNEWGIYIVLCVLLYTQSTFYNHNNLLNNHQINVYGGLEVQVKIKIKLSKSISNILVEVKLK